MTALLTLLSCGKAILHEEEKDDLLDLLTSLGVDGGFQWQTPSTDHNEDQAEFVDVDVVAEQEEEEEEDTVEGLTGESRLPTAGERDSRQEIDEYDYECVVKGVDGGGDEKTSREKIIRKQRELRSLCHRKSGGTFNCPLCSSIQTSFSAIMQHIAVSHFQTEIAEKRSEDMEEKWCSACRKTFVTRQVAVIHFGVVHGDVLDPALHAIRASGADLVQVQAFNSLERVEGEVEEDVEAAEDALVMSDKCIVIDPNDCDKGRTCRTEILQKQRRLKKLFRLKNSRTFECPLCASTQITLGAMMQHIAMFHFQGYIAEKRKEDMEEKRCSTCQKTFSSKQMTAYHFGIFHGDVLDKALDVITSSQAGTLQDNRGDSIVERVVKEGVVDEGVEEESAEADNVLEPSNINGHNTVQEEEEEATETDNVLEPSDINHYYAVQEDEEQAAEADNVLEPSNINGHNTVQEEEEEATETDNVLEPSDVNHYYAVQEDEEQAVEADNVLEPSNFNGHNTVQEEEEEAADKDNVLESSSVNGHNAVQDEEDARNFECYLCSTKFSEKSEVLSHLSISHFQSELLQRCESSWELTCHLCGQMVGDEAELASHLGAEHEMVLKLLPPQDEADKRISDLYLSAQQLQRARVMNRMSVQDMLKKVKKLSVVRSHQRKVGRKWLCRYCGLPARRFVDLLQHISGTHFKRQIGDRHREELEEGRCRTCKTEEMRPDMMIRHFGSTHKEVLEMVLETPPESDRWHRSEKTPTKTTGQQQEKQHHYHQQGQQQQQQQLYKYECPLCQRKERSSVSLKSHLAGSTTASRC